MREILALPLLILGFGAAAQAAERPVASRAFPVGAFHRISSSASPDVVVTVGPAISVRAEGDSDAIDRLRIVVENGELRIGTRPDRGFHGWRRPLIVRVSLPSLDGAALSGSGNMRIDRLAAPAFAATVDGSGNLEISALRVERARIAVGGSGNVQAAGAVGQLELSVQGSGNADLRRLESRDARLAVSGSGNAELESARTADVSLSGSGNISVGGQPHCTIHKSGSGTVRCG
jgi:hypothetical protein